MQHALRTLAARQLKVAAAEELQAQQRACSSSEADREDQTKSASLTLIRYPKLILTITQIGSFPPQKRPSSGQLSSGGYNDLNKTNGDPQAEPCTDHTGRATQGATI